jgi:hypothetical protein
MTTKEKIFYSFSILFVSVVINFFVTNLSVSKSGQREEIRALLKATDAIFTSLDYLNRKGPEIPEIKEEIEKARSALRSSKLLQIRLESY